MMVDKVTAPAGDMPIVIDDKHRAITDTAQDQDDKHEGTSEVYVDPMMEKRVLRRLDFRFAPLFCALYFMSYLDRSNIGNAAVAGMTDQLGLTGPQFSTAVSVFYATYVCLMIPLVLSLRILKTHRAISVMAFAWSAVTIGTAFVRSFPSLVACRLVLGICEAGFFPCISLYITMVYNRREQGLRFAYLFAATSLSGMVRTTHGDSMCL